MADDLSRVGTLAGFAPHPRDSRTKTVIIVILAIAILVVGGGSFYYFRIYRPAQYARAVMRMYDDAMAEGKTYDRTTIRDDADYAGALDAIRDQRQLAERVGAELALLNPPATMTDISNTFEKFLELSISAFTDTEPRAEFFTIAADMRAEMKKFTAVILPESQPTGTSRVMLPPAPTAGAVRTVWEKTVPRTQVLGDALFKKEVSGLAEPSYAELKAAWATAGPGLPFLLGVIQKIRPEVRINTVPENLSKAELARADTAFRDIEKFSALLDTALSNASARDLLSFRFFPRQAELSEQNFELMQTIEGLRRDYGP